jgi:hypothetical protein
MELLDSLIPKIFFNYNEYYRLYPEMYVMGSNNAFDNEIYYIHNNYRTPYTCTKKCLYACMLSINEKINKELQYLMYLRRLDIFPDINIHSKYLIYTSYNCFTSKLIKYACFDYISTEVLYKTFNVINKRTTTKLYFYNNILYFSDTYNMFEN